MVSSWVARHAVFVGVMLPDVVESGRSAENGVSFDGMPFAPNHRELYDLLTSLAHS